ncbi:Mini-circle protein [Kitasatospora sp. MMS16-BH015]|uniref:DinB family protein n=1 Tax=Kitasatospora sp. MMS16-BH015 TaxID=2018025 RepID=UPI000CA2232F|nr:DinB family protein [Kitasatospora sp. MMS16-BH015]AUG75224.1 Mini-circle protein [Kitasatospora sp. MMS16-BH015]
MTTTRIDPSLTADELPMLKQWLDYHRATLALKCEGLTDEQLKLRPIAPSTLSLLGLVRHLAEVERWWFLQVLDGQATTEEGLYWTKEDEDADFNDTADADAAADLATWREQIRLADAVTAGLPLETVAKRDRRGEPVTLRWIMVHMIEEYARHNGHADVIREQIDGATGE